MIRKAKLVLFFMMVLGCLALLVNNQTQAQGPQDPEAKYSTVEFDQRTRVTYDEYGAIAFACFRCDIEPGGCPQNSQGACEKDWRQGELMDTFYICDGNPKLNDDTNCYDLTKIGPGSGCVGYNWPWVCCPAFY